MANKYHVTIEILADTQDDVLKPFLKNAELRNKIEAMLTTVDDTIAVQDTHVYLAAKVGGAVVKVSHFPPAADANDITSLWPPPPNTTLCVKAGTAVPYNTGDGSAACNPGCCDTGDPGCLEAEATKPKLLE